MAFIRPLRGIRYNQEKIGDLAAVIAPPYDVISPDEQARLHSMSDYNVVHLELGQDLPGDDETNNRYARARSFLDRWLAEGTLAVEPAPTFYVHRHDFSFRGARLSRLGLIAGVRLEDWSSGIVLPHENTLSRPKIDRMTLLRACECNLSPVMVLYEDAHVRQRLADYVEGRHPVALAVEQDGQEHSLWAITEADLTDGITSRLAPNPLFIADGHHRYETALQYRKDLEAVRGPLPADHPANFVMATLFDFADPGLVILPTHRMVRGLNEAWLADAPTALARFFDVQTFPVDPDHAGEALSELLAAMQRARTEAHAFGIYGLDRGLLHLVTLPRDRARELRLVGQGSAAYRQLDVSILHDFVLSELLGVDAARVQDGQDVAFTRDEMAALTAVRDGQCQLAIFLNSALPREIRDVAGAGDRMPQKSTYFYPKLPTGLVLNSLSEVVPNSPHRAQRS
jgi:uncharacterized protein (DUF1015 family)